MAQNKAIVDEPPQDEVVEEPVPSISVRSVTLTVIAGTLLIATLWWAQSVLIPVVLSILISYALDPLHRSVISLGLSRGISAALVLLFVTGLVAGSAFALRRQASDFVANVPKATQKVRQMARDLRGQGGTVDTVKQAADDLKRAAAEAVPPSDRGVTRVQIEEPILGTDLLWQGSMGAIELAGQVTVVMFLVYYALASGDLYKRRLVSIAGPAFAQKRLTVEIMNQIAQQIEGFLIARLLLTAIVGVATGLAFWGMGVSQPVMWGVAAGVLNNVPYLGPAILAAAAALSALIQFDSAYMAFVVGSVSVLIACIEGAVIAPWLLGRAGRMEPGIIFLGLTLFGWLWGIWGLLLAVPIMIVVKAVGDHVEGWGAISELLKD
jgi:predicted PurR-regulated permease PerM